MEEKEFYALNDKKGVVPTKDDFEDDSDEGDDPSVAKKKGIEAPDIDDPDFELKATQGLEGHWEAWKNQNGYRFKEEKFDDLQLKKGFAGEFEDDE